jgi:flagellar protein FlgJ
MAIAPLNPSFYADPTALDALKREAGTQSPEALREVARQFESLFTNMMLKSMRSASEGDPLFGSDQADFYQDMFDQQLAVELGKGRGLGLADMLLRQLMQGGDSLPTNTPTIPEVPSRG